MLRSDKMLPAPEDLTPLHEVYRQRAERAEARVARLTEALRWYADGACWNRSLNLHGARPEQYRDSAAMQDAGAVARAALAKEEEK